MMWRFPAARVLSASERLYRFLLHVYPAAYRREYGPLMIQAYHDLCHSVYRQRGMAGLAPLWVRLSTDLATSAVGQHLDALREGGRVMTKREHALAIIAATFPLAIGLGLSLINPGFVSHLFANSSAQPWGWVIVAAVFILSGMAYLSQRKAFELAGRADSSDRAFSRPIVRNLLRAGGIALFVLPAILLVVLGPAIMVLLEAGYY
jgi:hypothetical protein